MNKLASLSLIAAAALSLAPKPAQAGDKEAALVGGFIGGLIVGAVIADNNHHVGYAPVPVYQAAPVAVCQPAPVVVDSCNTGYWNDARVQVYVPGCWAYRYDCGRQVRYYVNSHYEWRTNRVWVASNSRSNNNHGRQVSSGYGRDNGHNNDRDHSRDNGGRDDRRNH